MSPELNSILLAADISVGLSGAEKTKSAYECCMNVSWIYLINARSPRETEKLLL